MCAHVYIKTMTYFLVVHAGMKVANIAKNIYTGILLKQDKLKLIRYT